MAISGSVVEQIRIGKEKYGYVYQQVPRDMMDVKEHDVVELWIGTRGLKPAGSEKLVLVKNRRGAVEALNMNVRSLAENGVDENGQKIEVLDGGWTDVLLFSKGDVIWRFEPECEQEDPLKPGTYQWGSPKWRGKGSYTTTKVPPEERDWRKRPRLEEQRIVDPQKVLFGDVEELQFTVFGKVRAG